MKKHILRLVSFCIIIFCLEKKKPTITLHACFLFKKVQIKKKSQIAIYKERKTVIWFKVSK